MSYEVSEGQLEVNMIEEQIYKNYGSKKQRLREEFKELTSKDKKLKEYFKDTPMAQMYTNINNASALISDINFNNMRNSILNIKEQEEMPYSKKQQELADEFNMLGLMQDEEIGKLCTYYYGMEVEI